MKGKEINNLSSLKRILSPRFLTQISGRKFAHLFSFATDCYFKDKYNDLNLNTKGISLVALGGYGRAELCVHSDIDILLLIHDNNLLELEKIAHNLFVPLWDMGFEVGHSVWTISNCLALAKENFEVLASLLDARFIVGDKNLFKDFQLSLAKVLNPELKKRFIHWLQENRIKRGDRFGSASSQIEPHLKESLGGLRDYHYLKWVAKVWFSLSQIEDLVREGLISHPEYEELQESVDFIFLVRNQLHFLSKRRNDILHFEIQPTIAQQIGFEDKNGKFAVENFLSILHKKMSVLEVLCNLFYKTHFTEINNFNYLLQEEEIDVSLGICLRNGTLDFEDTKYILSNNLILLEIFKYSAMYNIPISWESRRIINELVSLLRDSLYKNEESSKIWEDILVSDNVYFALKQMLDTEFLAKFFPDFGVVSDFVQFDAYHIYPTGAHSVKTVDFIVKVKEDNLWSELIGEYSNDISLRWAALFHDIGKIGPNHSLIGAQLAKKILTKLNLENNIIDIVCFLIENHLLLVKTATRQDLEDESVIVNLASKIESSKKLGLLTLLSYADAKATGPKAWNPWVESLLREVFFKVKKVLEQGVLAEPHLVHRLASTRDKLRELGKKRFSLDFLESTLDSLPARYLLHHLPQEIYKHIELIFEKKDKQKRIVFQAKPDKKTNLWEIIIVGDDFRGVFMKIVGVLTMSGLNIFSADLNSLKNGLFIDIFRVSNPPDPLFVDEFWEKVESRLDFVFSNKLDVDKEMSSMHEFFTKNDIEIKVSVDNNKSDFYTVIEVIADDKPGFLYKIAKTLLNLDLDVLFARVATYKDKVVDVFYVLDKEKEKIVDPLKIEEIEFCLKSSF
ncbi:UTP--GlnB (protein PII) uridylyltransferase, GlnD [Desulfonauticus submarinus]|uniref:Bifunctional uridylyltransferase/uridylyl-removing enzyme n=1 Tax=Desulfonauticus submarinus TaxID=206665 RepID=A0A1H0F6A1_9BACT|nr:[protein-PII] uridylyltransferase [Desulfonauticus submarinus]SDN90123.1 UTP--GlnB (protein PII) uridylyltransferase, GlnD [Desulfonauticus submarinus]